MSESGTDRDETTILKVPLVPFGAAFALVASGAVIAITVNPAGLVFSLLGLAAFVYRRDVEIDRSVGSDTDHEDSGSR
ncbi:hypothetical protein [Natronorubrum thiooxidans]|uniref:Uncharacterized protein n=1 Tax=Natronorubrum thiooxidans TaxID=308853 RepID=A0A1N7GPP9_9EURY|nr:hypothetical protein [Natronorubrum thiooxidans]SIS14531.1 hypothetical protein SAMN05421752_11423 [Natronorubrum thiooxidans]